MHFNESTMMVEARAIFTRSVADDANLQQRFRVRMRRQRVLAYIILTRCKKKN